MARDPGRTTRQFQAKRIAFFPPWFLEKKTLLKIRQMLPEFYHKRLRFYFEVYGCIRCNRKDVIYCCGGLCLKCQWTVYNRLKKSDEEMKRVYRPKKEHSHSAVLLKRHSVARRLLRDLREG